MQKNKIYNDASEQSRTLIETILLKKTEIGKCQRSFIVGILLLFLKMKGRHHFQGMSRYGEKCEKSYRLNFEKHGEDFDFQWFNKMIIEENCSNHLIIVFDPSYLPKSGKHTPNTSKRWSGCLGKAAWGMEIGGIGIVDIENNTAFHYEAVPTPSNKKLKELDETLLDNYASTLIARHEQLEGFSRYLCVDGYFSKKNFVDRMKSETSLDVISKLRKDAKLQYLYDGPQRGGRGRPRKYDGDVNLNKLNFEYFKIAHEDEEALIYEAIVWAKALKRKIKLTYVKYKSKDGKITSRYALLFSTDWKLDALMIYKYYKARFQIEFLFRDAKQHTGLTHCQARSENKLYFHFNIALTAVNVAKSAHWIPLPKDENGQKPPFSLANIKTLYFNELVLDLFFNTFGIQPNEQINKQKYLQLITFGCMSA